MRSICSLAVLGRDAAFFSLGNASEASPHDRGLSDSGGTRTVEVTGSNPLYPRLPTGFACDSPVVALCGGAHPQSRVRIVHADDRGASVAGLGGAASLWLGPTLQGVERSEVGDPGSCEVM